VTWCNGGRGDRALPPPRPVRHRGAPLAEPWHHRCAAAGRWRTLRATPPQRPAGSPLGIRPAL